MTLCDWLAFGGFMLSAVVAFFGWVFCRISARAERDYAEIMRRYYESEGRDDE